MKSSPDQIKPSLGLFDTVMVVISLIIGIGIFRSPREVAKLVGSPDLFFAAWILGGITALIGGLVYAEIGARKPLAGGFYKVVSDAWHPSVAFMMNYMNVLSTCASAAAVAIIGSEYLRPLLPLPAWYAPPSEFGQPPIDNWIPVMSWSILMVIFGINMLGIKMGSMFQNVISAIKIGMILLFSCMALFSGHDEPVAAAPSLVSGGSSPLFLVGAGMVSVFFAFGGYQHTINLGNDVRNAKRNMPWGIVIGVVAVFVLYLLINVCYVSTLGIEGMASSKLVAADTAEVFLGDFGARLVKVAIFISAFGYLNATMIQSPRVYYAMAEDKVMPPVFMRVNQRTQVQGTGLMFFTAVSLIFVFTQGSFGQIVNYIIFNDSLILAVVASAILPLRGWKRDLQFKGFKLPFHPVLPILYMLLMLFVAYMSILNMWNEKKYADVLISLAVVIIGYPLYLLMRRLFR
jgi:APA family basic amino acid/polyamine antiporter